MRKRIQSYFDMLFSSDVEQEQLSISLIRTDEELLKYLETYLPTHYAKLTEYLDNYEKHIGDPPFLKFSLRQLAILLIGMELNQILNDLCLTYKYEK